ncbi:Protein misato 1 [Cichlidogyrus casuarinus]|uniref:Protein misato 1 n=1 Tax=Cichlidogyrus casuarinus TaxID=1844966 RepID=A0ABD2PT14_9PLAT
MGILDFSNKSTAVAWEGEIQVFKGEDYSEIKQSLYWTDCLIKKRVLEKTLFPFKSFQSCPVLNPLPAPYKPDPNSLVFTPQGQEAFHNSSNFDEIDDRMRKLSEACDWPSGFMFVTDSANGFAGVALAMVDYLSDEYSKKSLFTLPVQPNNDTINSFPVISRFNICSLYSRLESTQDSLSHSVYCPLIFDAFDQPSVCGLSQKFSNSLSSVLTAFWTPPDKQLDNFIANLEIDSYTKRMLQLHYQEQEGTVFSVRPKFMNPWCSEEDNEYFYNSNGLSKYIFSCGYGYEKIDSLLSSFEDKRDLKFSFVSQDSLIVVKDKTSTCCSSPGCFNTLSLFMTAQRATYLAPLFENIKSRELKVMRDQLHLETDDLFELTESVKNLIDKYNF